MESQSVALIASLAVLKFLALIVIPFAMTNLAWAGLKRLTPEGFFQVPVVYTFARFTGVGLGFALIYAHKGGAYYDLHAIFLPESPWNTTFWIFISERVNPINYDPGVLFDRIGVDGNNIIFTLFLTILILIFITALGSCQKFWRGKEAWYAVLAVVAISILMAFLTIYTLSLLFWSMYLFNYWVFLVLAMIVQYYRSRSYGKH